MDRQNLLRTFKLQQQAGLNQNIEPERYIKQKAFVFDLNHPLVNSSDMAQFKFAHQTSLVNSFSQTRSFEPVNING